MDEEMVWRKAIPRSRDRWQSKALTGGVGMLLAGVSLHTVYFAYPLAVLFPAFVFGSLGISIAFALVALGLRATTPVGAACGGMVCLLLVFWLGSYSEPLPRSGLTPLAVLFVLTFTATRIGRQRKVRAGLAERRKGRSAAQVIANLGMAGLTSSWIGARILLGCIRCAIYGYNAPRPLLGTIVLAALAEATADTVSSEIGQAFGGQPVMLTTFRPAERGVDGAVSVLGTLAGVAAGAIVVFTGQWALRLGWKQAFVALTAGIAGLFFDSVLGATVERQGWIGNDLVNFASTLFAVLVAFGLMIFVS